MSEDAPNPPSLGPETQLAASAGLIRMLRSAHISGADLRLDASSAGSLADHMEQLAKLVDMMVAESRALIARQSEFQAQIDELQGMCDFLKDLVIQSQKPSS